MHFLVGLLRLFRIFGMLIGIRGKKWAVLTGSAKTNLSAAHAAYSAKRSLPSHRNDVPPLRLISMDRIYLAIIISALRYSSTRPVCT